MKNKSKELKIAIKAAKSAGKIVKKYFELELDWQTKDDNSILTVVDGKSEEIIKKIISKNFKDHCILGEETGSNQKVCNYTWHIDPIDGTRNFAKGIPFSAISIALECTCDLLVGVVYNPMTDSLFYAEKEKGAYLNNKKIFVSKDDAKHSVVAVTSGSMKDGKSPLFAELLYSLPKNVVRSVRDLGCAALDLCYVARGGLEANIQLRLNSYDFAAGALIVQEAGGMITDLEGNPWKFPENNFIASNGVFHDKLVEEIKRQKNKLNI